MRRGGLLSKFTSDPCKGVRLSEHDAAEQGPAAVATNRVLLPIAVRILPEAPGISCPMRCCPLLHVVHQGWQEGSQQRAVAAHLRRNQWSSACHQLVALEHQWSSACNHLVALKQCGGGPEGVRARRGAGGRVEPKARVGVQERPIAQPASLDEMMSGRA